LPRTAAATVRRAAFDRAVGRRRVHARAGRRSGEHVPTRPAARGCGGAGMSFLSPWSLLALFAVPAIVVLHLYRRRLPDRRVAAVFLFFGERLAADAGRQRTRLLRTPSLWLECLAAALLALWLAGPSFGGVASRHVVFVLDDSASMAAGDTARAVLA